MKKILRNRILSFVAVIVLALQLNVQGQTPFVTVIQPSDAGIEWIVGTSHLISWNDNFVFPAVVELWDYTVPAVPVLVQTISAAATGTTLTWDIPALATVGTHYKIKVSSSACGDCYSDVSNSEFALVNATTGTTIHVEQPNTGSINWCKGSTHVISWSGNAPGHKKIKLYKGGSEHSVINGDVEGSTYEWTLPNDGSITADNDYKVRVSCKDDDNVFDFSDADFTISPSGSGTITVLQPNVGGITWTKGDAFLISWTKDFSSNVDIELWKGGVWHSNIVSNIPGSTYVWTIPNGTATASDYKIKVKSHDDSDTDDFSDADFAIRPHATGTSITVVQPSGTGISWVKGTNLVISWNDNVPGKMKISLYKGGVLHSVLAEDVVGSTWNWTLSTDVGFLAENDYKIRVSAMLDGTMEDFSDENFTVAATGAGTVTVLQPSVGSITWVRGSSYLISWIDNVDGTMDIELFKGGVSAGVIASDIVGSTWVWAIPIGTAIGTDYTIKVKSHTDAGTIDVSDNNFSIQATPAGGTIMVIQPNGGENWFEGLSYYISWNDNFPEPVNIYLCNSAGTTLSTLATGVVGSTWVWNTTGTALGTNYKIRISSSLEATLTDLSDADFSIICLPLVNSVFPNPANDHITLSLNDNVSGNYTLTMTNRFNLQVMNRSLQVDDNKEVNLSTAEIPNGIYFVTISSNQSVETHKIIIQH